MPTKLKPSTTANLSALESATREIDAIRAQLSLDTITVRPTGGITVNEYAARYKVHRCKAEDDLSRAVREGLMDKVRVRLVIDCGRSQPVWVYVPKR